MNGLPSLLGVMPAADRVKPSRPLATRPSIAPPTRSTGGTMTRTRRFDTLDQARAEARAHPGQRITYADGWVLAQKGGRTEYHGFRVTTEHRKTRAGGGGPEHRGYEVRGMPGTWSLSCA